jgi:hypothetical protein
MNGNSLMAGTPLGKGNFFNRPAVPDLSALQIVQVPLEKPCFSLISRAVACSCCARMCLSHKLTKLQHDFLSSQSTSKYPFLGGVQPKFVAHVSLLSFISSSSWSTYPQYAPDAFQTSCAVDVQQ